MGWRAQLRGWQAVLLMTVLPLAACGGRVEHGGSGSENDPTSQQALGGKSTDPGFDPTTDSDLGDCKMGPLEGLDDTNTCAWVAAGRCYSDRAMACNCVCPRSGKSVCLSSFD